MAAYLDHNATTPLLPAARAAMLAALDAAGNASSVHAPGRAARATVERARGQVAALIGATPDEVIFTSGGTEANALALASFAGALVVGATEHASVLEPARRSCRLRAIPVARNGLIDLDALDRILAETGPGALVSVMLANNETGVIGPVAQAAAIAHARGALIHTDAVQAAGKMHVDVAGLGVDYLTLSAHKLGGPQGAGALFVKAGAPLQPLLTGGGQEGGRRAGTENVAAIAGFGAAAAERNLARQWEHVAELRDGLQTRLREALPDVIQFCRTAPRLPTTLLIAAPAQSAATQLMALDLAGVSVSAGSACSSGKVTPSHVVTAMGYDEAVAARAIRISLGWNSGQGDVDAFLAAYIPFMMRTAPRRDAVLANTAL